MMKTFNLTQRKLCNGRHVQCTLCFNKYEGQENIHYITFILTLKNNKNFSVRIFFIIKN